MLLAFYRLLNQSQLRLQNTFCNLAVTIFIKRNTKFSDKILVLRTGGLGDFLFSVPALIRLRANTNKSISLITNAEYGTGKIPPWAQMLLGKYVDEVMALDISSWRKIIQAILINYSQKNYRFDQIIFLHHPLAGPATILKRIFLLWLMGIRGKLVYGHLEEAVGSLFRVHHSAWGVVRHKSSRPIEIVNEIFDLKHSITKDEINAISELGIPPSLVTNPEALTNIALISPECKLSFKGWPIEKYQKLMFDFLDINRSMEVWIVGNTKEEEFLLQKLIEHPRIIDYRRSFTIPELVYIFNKCKFVITNDGGMAHLASMSGAKLVSIANGGEEPGVVTPIGENTVEVRNATNCAPCFGMSCCPRGDPICVTGIEIINVEEAIDKVVRATNG